VASNIKVPNLVAEYYQKYLVVLRHIHQTDFDALFKSDVTPQANFLWKITFDTLYVRATGHKTPGESSVNITVSSYDTTHLQKNPQRLG